MVSTKHSAFTSLVGTAVLVLLASCSGPQPTAFVTEEHHQMQHEKWLPCDLVWRDPDAAWSTFDSIQVAKVNTDYLLKMSWWDKATVKGDNKDDAVKLGQYMRKRMIEALKKRKDNKFPVTETAKDKTIILELALTELVPTKAWLNVATVAFVGAWSKGSVAMEGRIRVASTGKIIAKFADRRNGKLSPPGVQDVTWWWHAEQIIDDWAEEFAEIMNIDWGKPVKGITWFTLKPW